MDFRNFNFKPQVSAGVEAAGYQSPTPIQARAIPPVMEGRDVMGLAQTGTGKTAAFVLRSWTPAERPRKQCGLWSSPHPGAGGRFTGPSRPRRKTGLAGATI
jgi:hypothetical protein